MQTKMRLNGHIQQWHRFGKWMWRDPRLVWWVSCWWMACGFSFMHRSMNEIDWKKRHPTENKKKKTMETMTTMASKWTLTELDALQLITVIIIFICMKQLCVGHCCTILAAPPLCCVYCGVNSIQAKPFTKSRSFFISRFILWLSLCAIVIKCVASVEYDTVCGTPSST